jgi:riboflavin kinase/FMN adenylyltransferase
MVVAIGVFDGIHLGHKAVLNTLLSYKNNPENLGKIPQTAVMTFRNETITHKHGGNFKYIYPTDVKIQLLKKMGLESVFMLDFEIVKVVTAEHFATEIKTNGVRKVIIGEGFRFGQNALGNADTFRKCGLEVVEVPKVYTNIPTYVQKLSDYAELKEVISSQKIRELISKGQMLEIRRFLGANQQPQSDSYSIFGIVKQGNHIGKKINFPTINQHFGENQITPAFGVYKSNVTIDGIEYNSITNIGSRPTIDSSIQTELNVVNDTQCIAETHILDFDGDLYGKRLEVKLGAFIRAERKFSTLDELKKAIIRDKNYN